MSSKPLETARLTLATLRVLAEILAPGRAALPCRRPGRMAALDDADDTVVYTVTANIRFAVRLSRGMGSAVDEVERRLAVIKTDTAPPSGIRGVLVTDIHIHREPAGDSGDEWPE